MQVTLTEYEIKEMIEEKLEKQGFVVGYLPNDIEFTHHVDGNVKILSATVEVKRKQNG